MRRSAPCSALILGLLPVLFWSIAAPADATVTWIFSGSLDDLPDNPLPAGTPFALSLAGGVPRAQPSRRSLRARLRWGATTGGRSVARVRTFQN